MYLQRSNYTCELCQRKFIRLSAYHLHMRYHENPRPFPCGYCRKGYTSQSSLAVHVRRHTGETLYDCEFCGKGFAAKVRIEYSDQIMFKVLVVQWYIPIGILFYVIVLLQAPYGGAYKRVSICVCECPM